MPNQEYNDVWEGRKMSTKGGLRKKDLMINNKGHVISKARHDAMKARIRSGAIVPFSSKNRLSGRGRSGGKSAAKKRSVKKRSVKKVATKLIRGGSAYNEKLRRLIEIRNALKRARERSLTGYGLSGGYSGGYSGGLYRGQTVRPHLGLLGSRLRR